MQKVILFFLLSLCSASAAIRSISGNIGFDSNSDNVYEAILDVTGMGIGTNTPSANLHVVGNAIVSGTLAIGSASGGANLHINGSIAYHSTSVSDNTSLPEEGGSSIVLANTSSGNLFLDLPYAGNVTGRIISIKKISASNDLIVTAGSNLIDSNTYLKFSENTTSLQSVKMVSDGVQWKILYSDTSSEIASGNLVGWWKLDETSLGTVTDSSGQGLHGTHTGMISDNVGVAGKLDRCIFLNSDTTADYVNMGNSVNTAGWSAISAMAWVNPRRIPTLNSGQVVSNYEATVTGGFYLGTDESSGQHSVAAGVSTDSGQAWRRDGVIASANVWSHIAMTYDTINGLKVYLNGEQDPTVHVANGSLKNVATGDIRLGQNATFQYPFDGYVDDVRIYSKALTRAEILTIMGNGQ